MTTIFPQVCKRFNDLLGQQRYRPVRVSVPYLRSIEDWDKFLTPQVLDQHGLAIKSYPGLQGIETIFAFYDARRTLKELGPTYQQHAEYISRLLSNPDWLPDLKELSLQGGLPPDHLESIMVNR